MPSHGLLTVPAKTKKPRAKAPDSDCHTLPTGECVAPVCELHGASSQQMPDHEEIKTWLLSKGIAAWGQIFTTIEGKESLDLAATWIQGQITSFLEFRSGRS